MGNLWSWSKEPPQPMVLVSPLLDFPPVAARTGSIDNSPFTCNIEPWLIIAFRFDFNRLIWMMLESSYKLLFGKLVLRCLFEYYFEEAKHFSTKLLLKPIDDPHVDLTASVSIKAFDYFT
ncbi:hypothetical protein Ccrd_012430, partial [Cynara cardunculus var. scolymus]